MSTENRTISRRVFEEGFNKGDLSFADQCLAKDHVSHDPHNPPGYQVGPEGIKQIIRLYRGAFPDIHFTIDDQMSDGDRVVTRWTSRGTHRGPLGDIPPTGKSVLVTGITIDRIQNGKVTENWLNWDMAGLMQQLQGQARTGERARPDGGRPSQPQTR